MFGFPAYLVGVLSIRFSYKPSLFVKVGRLSNVQLLWYELGQFTSESADAADLIFDTIVLFLLILRLD